MSFRKRNIGLSTGTDRTSISNSPSQPQRTTQAPPPTPGIRPSPDDGRATISTGSPSLDNLMAGHGGLPIGKILLVEENGTTDFAGALLRYYAAEGVVQDQKVHVIGMPEQWGRTLPGLIGPAEAANGMPDRRKSERMKIAWRYERLGEFGAGVAGARVPAASAGDQIPSSTDGSLETQPAFCHAFDLTKRLIHPSIGNITYMPIAPSREPLLVSIQRKLQVLIASSPPNTVHRIVIPSFLNPTVYPPEVSQPENVLPFLHSLRGLMSLPTSRITAMITLPLSLFPRTLGLVRWMEILSDGVIELCPFPHSSDALSTSGAATAHEEPPQGMLKMHRLPVLHERGGGGDHNIGQDWAFTLSRRKFEIKPFSLPPAEGDTEAQDKGRSDKMPKKADLEF